MTTQTITPEQKASITEVYRTCTNPNKPANFMSNEGIHTVWAKDINGRVSEETFRQTLKLYAAVAPQVSEDEFVHWVVSGELPVVKLTPEQMEAARGGTISGAIFVGCLAGAAVVAGACCGS